MTRPTDCRKCGMPLPPDAPAGGCPKCLLKAGIDGEAVESGHADTLISGNSFDSDTSETDDESSNVSRSPDAPSSADTATIVRYFGEYELLEEIARGGMGVVYRARQTRLNRMVALKMILAGQLASGADVRRFQTEAEAAAKLDHPGIVPIFEVGEHDGHHFYSMALVNGEALSERLAHGPLAPREAAEFVRAMALAVQHAHERGVIHRDLKPANVLIDPAGQPRVTDFGLARQVFHESSLTTTGQVLGTPEYMSPEQAAGYSDRVSEPADVYALGAVFYACLTGRPPFVADAAVATLQQVVASDPVSASTLNSAVDIDLQTIVHKCLEKRPEDRYSSAREFAEDLQRFLTGVPILARPIGYSQRLWRMARRRPLVLALIASVLVAVLSVAGLVFQMSSGNPSDLQLTPEIAGQLVSEAASIPNDEWAAISGGATMPSTTASGNSSMFLILFGLYDHSVNQMDRHPNAAEDFQYQEPRPKPYQLAQAIWISKDKGYASFIQPEYISDCSVQQEADTAHGTVSFAADDLYSGKLNYVARRRENIWIIEELHMPNLGVSLQRSENGTWSPLRKAVRGEATESEKSKVTDG